jgi:eukaryotic-like serine/threonine-protein kinase
MNSDEWARVNELFQAALAVPPAERGDWIGAHCGEAEVNREVRSLLSVYEQEPGFLEQGTAEELPDVFPDLLTSAATRERIGSYRLVREIGHGGMGVVYEAERERDFTQRVAIKLVRPEWHSEALVEKFRYERRILARLEHPGIARLLDGGTTEEGAPFFVMEFVDGVPIDDYCRERGLDIRKRVELFERVAAAVEHAHSHLVLHRDLKPSNILVTPEGQPKLLDFGIAKVLLDDAVESTELTGPGLRMFTPAYASPEQVIGGPLTTSTDVYSLGALLYFVLTGGKPYDLAGMTAPQALKTVCESVPQRPSSMAGAAQRQVLAGDLDNIVMKCLRKEPAERYPSVHALADDLRAWREGCPVSASTRTLRYEAGKFFRRYKLQVIAAGFVLLAMVSGGVATAWEAHVARQERDRAQNRFRQVREFSRSLLFEVHESLRKLPGATEPRLLLLARAVDFLDGLAKDAKNDTALQLEVAEGYRQLGLIQGAAYSNNVGDRKGATRSFEKAAALAEEAIGRQPRLLDAQLLLTAAYNDLAIVRLDDSDRAGAEAAFRRHMTAMEMLERDHPADHRARLSLATGYSSSGRYLTNKNDTVAAKAFYRKAIQAFAALAGQEQLPPSISTPYAFALKRLGAILIVDGSLDEAERNYRKALELDEQAIRREPTDSQLRFNMTYALSDLALIAIKRLDYASAEGLYRRALEIRVPALAADPADLRTRRGLAYTRLNLGEALRLQKRLPEAGREHRESFKLRQELVRLDGPTPANLVGVADAAWYLAQSLLDHAEATPAGRHRRQLVEEAQRLLATASAVVAVKANAELDPDLRSETAKQSRRAERLAKFSHPQ